MAILTVETLKKRHGWWRMKDITLPYFFFKPKVSPEKRISCDNGEWFIDGIAVDEVRNQVTTYAEPHFFLLEFVYWIASGFNGIRDRFALLVLHDLMQIEHSLSPIEGYPESQNKEETLRKSRGYLNEHKQHLFMDNDRCVEIYEALNHWSNMDEGPIPHVDRFPEEKKASEDESKAESHYHEPKEKQPVVISTSEASPIKWDWELYLTKIEQLIEEMITLLQKGEGGAITYSALAKKIRHIRRKALRQYHPDPPGNTNDDEHFKSIEPILTALKKIQTNGSSEEKNEICRELTIWKANLADLRNIESILEIQEQKRQLEEALDNLLQKLVQEVMKIKEDLATADIKITRLCANTQKLDKEMKKDRKIIKQLLKTVGLPLPPYKEESEHTEEDELQLSIGPEFKNEHDPKSVLKEQSRNRYRWDQQGTSSSVSTAGNSSDEALLTEDDEDTSEEESTTEVSCNV